MALLRLVVVLLALGGCIRAGFEDRSSAGLHAHDGAVDAACRSQLLTILATANDGEIDHDGELLPRGESASTWGPDPDGIYIGYWNDTTKKIEGLTRAFFRFRLTTPLPQQATVSRAELALHGLHAPESSLGWAPTTHALRVLAEDAADAPAVTSTTLPAMLPQTVRWPAQGGLAWQVDAANTVDLAALLQALVDSQGGLVAGAHVQLWLWGDFTDASAEVGTPDVGRPGAVPAQLDLRWCE